MLPVNAPSPATSAVRAGWICVGIGLLTAWFFPLANVFFSIAMILSVVALATHQVRSGLLLLAGALGSLALCVVLFFGGVVALLAGAVHAAARAQPEARSFSRALPTPIVSRNFFLPTPYPSSTRSIVSVLTSNTAGKPLALDEVTIMLSDGRRDDEIIAATSGRPMQDQIGTPEITSLRAFGASDRLIDNLRMRPMSGNVQRPMMYTAPAATATFERVAVSTPTPPAVQMPVAAVAKPIPVDYAARDRQIAALDKQIKALDDSINDWRIHHAGAGAYINQMEQTRDDRRRQKWAVEGR